MSGHILLASFDGVRSLVCQVHVVEDSIEDMVTRGIGVDVGRDSPMPWACADANRAAAISGVQLVGTGGTKETPGSPCMEEGLQSQGAGFRVCELFVGSGKVAERYHSVVV